MGAENQELGIEQALRLPAHAGVLAQAKQVARWLSEQHLRGDGQAAAGPLGMGQGLGEERWLTLQNLLDSGPIHGHGLAIIVSALSRCGCKLRRVASFS